MRAALAEARLDGADVDFVSAHGTATPLNDPIEAAALRRVLGARGATVPVNSIKGAFGHAMGAAAASKRFSVFSPAATGRFPRPWDSRSGTVHATSNCVQGVPRAHRPRISLSTSLGFGGCNAALVIESA
jgi:3-oxoacyl-(acyl-carrier-protein) synthase